MKRDSEEITVLIFLCRELSVVSLALKKVSEIREGVEKNGLLLENDL